MKLIDADKMNLLLGISELTITIKANVPAADAQGIKERIAMDIERYGDVKVVSIVSDRGREEQLRMKGAKL